MILETKKDHLELGGEEDMGKFITEFYFKSWFRHVTYITYFLSRGPNKYTRNWEDEDAYGKTTAGRVSNRRFQKNNEDFPALGNSKVTVAKYMTLFIAIKY